MILQADILILEVERVLPCVANFTFDILESDYRIFRMRIMSVTVVLNYIRYL